VRVGFRKGLESGPVGKEGEGWVVDEEIVKGTRERYAEAGIKYYGRIARITVIILRVNTVYGRNIYGRKLLGLKH
jgi:hypothetical protein